MVSKVQGDIFRLSVVFDHADQTLLYQIGGKEKEKPGTGAFAVVFKQLLIDIAKI